MKRLYSLLLSGLVLTASAAVTIAPAIKNGIERVAADNVEIKHRTFVTDVKKANVPAKELSFAQQTPEKAPKEITFRKTALVDKPLQLSAATVAKAPRKAPEVLTDYSGSYTMSSKSLTQYAAPSKVSIAVTDESTGEAEISGLVPLAEFKVKAYFNLEEGTLSIPNLQVIGEDEDGEIEFYVKGVSNEGKVLDGACDKEATTGTIDGGVITFPTYDIWAIGNHALENLGYYLITYQVQFTLDAAGENPDEGWTSLGSATLEDGWLLPGLGIDQTDPANWYEVELQRNIANPNVYRLVDPYKGESPAAAFNSSATPGYIQFDVTDPDHVSFACVTAGFANEEMGISEFYCTNYLTWYAAINGMSPDIIVSFVGDMIPYATFKDGILYLGHKDNSDGTTDYDAGYATQANPSGKNIWKDGDTKLNMDTRVFFPGVDPVIPDDPEKPGDELPWESYTWTYVGAGKYKDTVLSALYGGKADLLDVEVFEADGHPGFYMLSGAFANLFTKSALYVDATDPDNVVIPIQPTGLEDIYDGMTWIASSEAIMCTDYGMTPEEFIAEFPNEVLKVVDGVIDIPMYTLYLQWPDAPANSPYGTDPEGWDGNYEKEPGVIVLPGGSYVEPDPDEGWTSLGDATFEDGWVLPAFSIDQTDPANWYTVELQQNDENPNVYRLVDPYKGNSPIASVNESTRRGYLEFDVTDPEHVVLHNVDAGFAITSPGIIITEFYCNTGLSYLINLGYTLEQALAVMDGQFPVTTFKDGVVNFGSIVNDKGETVYDACFGMQGQPNSTYGWTNANMEAKIIFPNVSSVGGISVKDEENEPVFYNLFGQRIKTPATPGIYIRNNKKVVVR